MFNDTVKPLKGFSNIKIVNKFLSQEEIATLHKQFGIFLCPTRLDSQGVSMCEAMSSGLVPVTINTTAIPEFVTEFQGILAPEEDYVAMANGIEEIYNNPSMFLQMSVNSSKLIQDKCGKEKIIEKECAIIKS